MGVCKFCGKELPNQGNFCGYCDQITGHSPETPASTSGLPTVKQTVVDTANPISEPDWEWEDAFPNQPGYAAQLPASDEAEEEEKRRRAATLGIGPAGLAGEGQLPAGNTPMVQGTPQFGRVPSVHGTPQVTGGLFGPNAAQGGYPSTAFHSSPTISVQRYAPSSAPPHAPAYSPPIHRPYYPPHHPHLQHRPPVYRPAGGCAPPWLIFLFAAIFIISCMTGIGLTVVSPSLSLSGGTDVALGDSLRLHGSGFIPISGVVLTLDDTTPLYFTYGSSTMQAFYGTRTLMSLEMPTAHLGHISPTKNIVIVGVDGSFNVTITIDHSWQTGQHTISASERAFPRSAVITISVHQPGQMPTTSSPSTDSFLGTPSLSPSTGPLGLSCINPTSITLGPVSEGYNQDAPTQVSLCAGGSGIVNWTATWDQKQAPWLQLNHSSGDIAAPGQQQINVSALAASMKPGTYSAMVTFSSQQSSTVETLNVTFTVLAGCIHTSQQEYNFTGVARVSDPQTQTLTVSNCGGIVGSWSTTTYTNDKINWLSVAPTNGALKGGATQSVTISASNLKTQLPAGTYGGRIVFNIGSNQVDVYITLFVEPGPQIILVSPASSSFNANKDCTLDSNLKAWICIASIRNGSSSLSLNWKASSSGVPGITFKPPGDTIPANGAEGVEITIPENTCQTPTKLTFSGPANAVNISWSCSLTA